METGKRRKWCNYITNLTAYPKLNSHRFYERSTCHLFWLHMCIYIQWKISRRVPRFLPCWGFYFLVQVVNVMSSLPFKVAFCADALQEQTTNDKTCRGRHSLAVYIATSYVFIRCNMSLVTEKGKKPIGCGYRQNSAFVRTTTTGKKMRKRRVLNLPVWNTHVPFPAPCPFSLPPMIINSSKTMATLQSWETSV